jgi:hypothetical protein
MMLFEHVMSLSFSARLKQYEPQKTQIIITGIETAIPVLEA